MRRAPRWMSLSIAAVCLFACTPAPVFISSYRTPDAEPLALKGERVAALILMYDRARRARAEDTLAREITKRGAVGVPMHQLLPDAQVADEETARAAIQQAGVRGVVVMRPRKAQKKVVTPPATYSMPIYYGFWGGYYPYGWGNVWGAPDGPERTTHGPQEVNPYMNQVAYDPGHVDVYDVIRVEVLIYSLAQNRLVWVGEAETDNPGTIDGFVENLVE